MSNSSADGCLVGCIVLFILLVILAAAAFEITRLVLVFEVIKWLLHL